ncbi:hypothetical protein ACU4GD_28760 [Cupriavidus basilensis]
MLIEQGQLSCGTTWHAAGLVGQLRAQESMTETDPLFDAPLQRARSGGPAWAPDGSSAARSRWRAPPSA